MRFGICRATGILEKSKRLRKAIVFIFEKLPISRAAEGRAVNRGMWGASFPGEDCAAGLTELEPFKNLCAGPQVEPEPPGTSLSRKDDGAPAGTVIPADANQGVSPILI